MVDFSLFQSVYQYLYTQKYAVGAVVIAFLVTKLLYWCIKSCNKTNQYRRMVRQALAAREHEMKRFVELYGDFVPQARQAEIIKMSASQIAEEIRNGKLTSKEAVISFGLRAIKVGKELNLLADTALLQAVTQAEEKDRQKKSLSTLPPLYGVPISVKDHLCTKGLLCTVGYSCNVAHGKSQADCVYVQMLKKNGAIPFIAGNVPQGLIGTECFNYVWGQAKNPYNPARVTGGSSGGEAGLVATCCAPLGNGSETGGSIRVPAAFCGVYGFKATSTRISTRGALNTQNHYVYTHKELPMVIGPMSRSVDDLILIMRALFGNFKATDPLIDRSPFDEKLLQQTRSRPLKIGYCLDDDLHEVSPAVKRAISMIGDKMREKGHKFIEFEKNWFYDFGKIGYEIVTAIAPNDDISVGLKGEKHAYMFNGSMLLGRLPNFMIRLVSLVFKLIGEERQSTLVAISTKKTLKDFHTLIKRKEEMKRIFFDYWIENEFDCVILPVFPIAAHRHKEFEFMFPHTAQTVGVNLLDVAAGTVPVTLVSKEDLHYETRFKDTNAKLLRQNVETSEGMPIAVQVCCLSGEDEKCLGIMKIISELLPFNHFPPEPKK